MTTSPLPVEREEFEKWAKDFGLSMHTFGKNGGYEHFATHAAFAAWNASRLNASAERGNVGVSQAQWQPIETAPKNTEVLMCWREHDCWTYEVKEAINTRGGWMHGLATHWMPLPSAPEQP